MLFVPLNNVNIRRTLRPLYAFTQATPWAGFLDPAFDRSFDILPGMVMAKLKGEVFTPYTGAAGQKPFGLSTFFVASRLGIDEISGIGSNLFTIWVGGADSEFEVLAPAFDQTADWTELTNGGIKLLTGNSQGKLTPAGATAANAICELISAPSPDKILVRFTRPTA